MTDEVGVLEMDEEAEGDEAGSAGRGMEEGAPNVRRGGSEVVLGRGTVVLMGDVMLWTCLYEEMYVR